MHVPDDKCLLCGNAGKIIDHLFFACGFTKWIFDKCYQATGGLVTIAGDLFYLTRQIGKLTHKLKFWGLHWTLIVSLSWSILGKRNCKIKHNKFILIKQLVCQCICIVDGGFKKLWFKKQHKLT